MDLKINLSEFVRTNKHALNSNFKSKVKDKIEFKVNDDTSVFTCKVFEDLEKKKADDAAAAAMRARVAGLSNDADPNQKSLYAHMHNPVMFKTKKFTSTKPDLRINIKNIQDHIGLNIVRNGDIEKLFEYSEIFSGDRSMGNPKIREEDRENIPGVYIDENPGLFTKKSHGVFGIITRAPDNNNEIILANPIPDDLKKEDITLNVYVHDRDRLQKMAKPRVALAAAVKGSDAAALEAAIATSEAVGVDGGEVAAAKARMEKLKVAAREEVNGGRKKYRKSRQTKRRKSTKRKRPIKKRRPTKRR